MGCASSRFLDDDDGRSVVIGAGFSHHVVSLTSTTYGLLTTLDHSSPRTLLQDRAASTLINPAHRTSPPPPPPPPPPLPSARLFPQLRRESEVIRPWDLMSGVKATTAVTPSQRLPDLRESVNLPLPKQSSNSHRTFYCVSQGKENAVLYRSAQPCFSISAAVPLRERNGNAAAERQTNGASATPRSSCYCSLEAFPRRCPPGGENAAVVYTTTLRGIRKTFEDCNAVRTALEGLGVWFKERDVSMDMGFRKELQELLCWMPGTEGRISLPRVFVRGRYLGGAEEVLRIHEQGALEKLLEGLPRARPQNPCDGCGGVRFLPCFRCCGGKKLAAIGGRENGGRGNAGRVVRCPECNENGLVQCPICC